MKCHLPVAQKRFFQYKFRNSFLNILLSNCDTETKNFSKQSDLLWLSFLLLSISLPTAQFNFISMTLACLIRQFQSSNYFNIGITYPTNIVGGMEVYCDSNVFSIFFCTKSRIHRKILFHDPRSKNTCILCVPEVLTRII